MKRLLISFAVLSMVLCSCNKITSTVSIYIEGIIVNGTTVEVLDSATVEIFSNNKVYSATTDENGYFYLGKFAIGDYTLIISRDGYSTELKQIQASQELLIFDNGVDVVKSFIFALYESTEKVEFTVFRRVPEGVTVAAANFPYKIVKGMFDPSIEGNTDENGRISLENMPSSFYLIIDHELNGYEYKFNSSVSTRYDSYVVINAYESEEGRLGLVSANILDEDGVPITDFQVNSSLELRFTIPVDIENSEFYLEEDGWNGVDFTYKWSDGNTKLTIDPNLSLNQGTMYEVSIFAYSEDLNQIFQDNISFTTAE